MTTAQKNQKTAPRPAGVTSTYISTYLPMRLHQWLTTEASQANESVREVLCRKLAAQMYAEAGR